MTREVEGRWFVADEIQEVRDELIHQEPIQHTPRRLTRRTIYDFPDLSLNSRLAWLRLREDEHAATLTYKQRLNDSLGGMVEHDTAVSNAAATQAILESIGLVRKSYQECFRESWAYPDGVHVTIDEWPWLNPFMEIEGPTPESVRNLSLRLGLDWSEAIFSSAEVMYLIQYELEDTFENRTAISTCEIAFDATMPELLRRPIS